MTDEATPREVGSHAGLGPTPERAGFDRWLRDNGHCEDQHDDMLMPLQRSLNELMWSAWKGAAVAERERCAAWLERVAHQPGADGRPQSDAAVAVLTMAAHMLRDGPNGSNEREPTA
jgi:hypothetical protein